MKKIILELLIKNFDSIKESWVSALLKIFEGKLSRYQISLFVQNTLEAIIQIIERTDYSSVDVYLIDLYNLFENADLNLLEVSELFNMGRLPILHYIDKDKDSGYDPAILAEFVEEIIEQLFARYSMLRQETQMKEISLDRDRLALKFEINQQYLKNILHTSDSAIMLIDNDEKYIAWNKGAEIIFGYKESEVLGQPSTLLLPKEEKYFKELEFIKEEVKRTGYAKIQETERLTKLGKIVSVELNVTLLPSNDGQYTGRSVIIKDFTEVKRLQQQIDQSEKLAVIGQLAAGVAHEIGNPLAAISSIVQILQRRSADSLFAEQLVNIKLNIDRISKIVRELVDFSRPPGHEKQFIQINDVVKTALGIVKYDKRVKNVKFETQLDPDLPGIYIVPDQLLQVFINILFNALDAINGEGEIEVISKHDKTSVFVEICDNGCGMDKETLGKIFDPFFTTKEVGKGTGLGLSVSYGIMKKFKGDILVTSEVGKGSCFTLKIPIYQGNE
ncbi:MAG: ATP-binding protein [Bacteroidota bacterium]|nr:ATP-binding protein [Bacteroidota bacterium]MDP4190418.1 ATP-binding protein [Bacteroidota bacterium]MDP4194557.1 ATP-binding protein [Bacteroidota bacterium]